MACPNCKKKRCNCPEPVQGPIGLTGPPGPQGETGPIPAHEWNGCQIRFENPDGSWGPWKNLEGPQGETGVGEPGSTGNQGQNGQTGIQGIQGIQGHQGIQGTGGRGIDSTHIDENGDLIINYSDGSTENAGNVRAEGGGGTPLGPNEKLFLFRANNNTSQKAAGGLAPGTIIAFSDDQSEGYYDYGGSWSGNSWLEATGLTPTLRFQLDMLKVTNNSAGAVDVTIDVQHIPGATGIPVSLVSRLINIGAGATEEFNIQTADQVYDPTDRVWVVAQTLGTDIDIESGAEFWNVEI